MSPTTPPSRSAASTKAAATRAAKAAKAAAAAEQAAADLAAAQAPTAGPGQPGPKPRSLVVEHTLKCQTAVDGEISLSLLVPYGKIKRLMTLDEDLEEAQMVDFILDEIMAEADAATLQGLSDGADTFIFAVDWMQALGERLGGSVGKSGPSSS